MGSRDEPTEQCGWFSRLHLSWPLLFVAGWLLYELTTQPTLGAVAVCLKFGWEDFRAAIWLRRVDRWRLRGRACFWLYLAWGLVKTAAIAGLMSIAFMAVSPKGPAAQGPRLQAVIQMFTWTGLTMLTGLSCATLTLCYATILARWGGFKLWLSRDIHRARRRNYWPPYAPNLVQKNQLAWMLTGALLILIFPLVILFSVVFIIISKINDRIAGVIIVGGLLFLMFAYPVGILVLRDRMRRWLIASDPSECWDTNAEPLSDVESMAEELVDPIE